MVSVTPLLTLCRSYPQVTLCCFCCCFLFLGDKVVLAILELKRSTYLCWEKACTTTPSSLKLYLETGAGVKLEKLTPYMKEPACSYQGVRVLEFGLVSAVDADGNLNIPDTATFRKRSRMRTGTLCSSQQSVTPLPEDPMPSSSLPG